MTKRIISFILIFVMTFSCLCFTTTASADSEVYGKEALQHIKNLGILPTDTDGDDIISRAQFAMAVYSVAGDEVVIPFERLYYDVEETDICRDAVMYCSENGYMVGSDGWFRPDDSVTYIEAMTVIARVLNYTDYAKNHGDYTLGYYTTAKNIGLLNNTGIVSSDSPLTAENCAVMLYNAMRIGMNKLSSISPIYYTYQTSNKIFAYEKLGLNYAKGIMQSNGYVDVTGKENNGEKSVVIDNARYSAKLLDESYRFLVGQEVSVFYDDDLNIVSIASTGVSNTVTVKKEYFSNKTGNTFNYTENDTSRKLVVSDKAIYFKNGKVVMGYNATGFANAEYADISFVDGDGDEVYDSVFVNIYTTYVVSNVFSDGVLYSVGNTYKTDLSEDVEKDIYVYNSSGELKTAGDIKKGYVVSVIENDKFIYVIYSNSVMTGELQEKDDYTAVLDGFAIDIPNGASKLFKDIPMGSSATIYLDFAGRGVYATKTVDTSSDEMLGYIVQGLFKDGFDKKIKIKIYSSTGILADYYVDSLFTVDGTKYRMNALTSVPDVFYNNGEFKKSVVYYKLNGENEITSITFPKTSLGESEDGLIQTASLQSAYKISNGSLTNTKALANGTYFSGKEFINDSTVIFVIPSDIEDEDKFAVITNDDVPVSTTYDWDLLHFSKYNGFVDVAVIHSDYAAISYDTLLSVVISTSGKLDNDGNERLAVKYYVDGEELVAMENADFTIKEYVIDEDGTKTAATIPLSALRPGDAVRLTVGDNGLIRQGERVYEYSKGYNGFKGSTKAGAYATHSMYMTSGFVAFNDNTLIRIADTKAGCVVSTGDIFNLTGAICSSAKIMIVEETSRGVSASMGTMADIAIGDRIVYQSRSGVVKYIIVFKDM